MTMSDAAADGRLGHDFRDRRLLHAVMSGRGLEFQRLEWLGDSVLDTLAVIKLARLDDWSSPSMAHFAAARQRLVSDRGLAEASKRENLRELVDWAASEHRLGDLVESAIGAAWLDGGWSAAGYVAEHLVLHTVPAANGSVPWIAYGPPRDADRWESASGRSLADARLLSAAQQYGPGRRRLAYIGDAVVEATAAISLYKAQPVSTEGVLSMLRHEVQSNRALLARSLEHGLDVRALEPRAIDDEHAADIFQALIGAFAMDAGPAVAVEVASRLLGL